MKLYSCMIAIFLLICMVSGVRADELRASLNSDTAIVGEPFLLSLEATGGAPAIVDFPSVKHVRLLSPQPVRSHMSIYNGQQTQTLQFALVADAAGEYVIPTFDVRVGKKTVKTGALRFKAVPAAERKLGEDAVPLSEAVFGKIRILNSRREFYLGEEVPISIDAFVIQGIQAQLLGYPDVKIPHAVFRDYRSSNPQDGRFARPESSRGTVLDGRRYEVLSIKTAFRSLAPGKVKIEATLPIGIAEPEERRSRRRPSMFDDDFFDSLMDGFGRTPMKQYQIRCEASPELTFKALPTIPAGVEFLGLVGNWSLDYSLEEPEKLMVGEVMTLHVLLQGGSSAETLDAPKLDLPGFRVYPPEIRQTRAGGLVVSYSMIPLHPGESKIDLKLAVFHPDSGEYVTADFSRSFEVIPSDRPLASVTAGAPAAPAEATVAKQDEEKNSGSSLLYLKTTPEDPVSLPVWRHWLWSSLLLLLAGPLLLLVVEWRHRVLLRRSGDANYGRRENARKQRSAVIGKLQRVENAEEMNRAINQDVVPLLSDALGLPPGSTAMELADVVDDQVLAGALRRAAQSAYRPGADESVAIENKGAVIRALKKLVVLFLCCLSTVGAADDTKKFSDAVKAYDNSEFQKAYQTFHKLYDTAMPDPALLYNMGASNYMLQDYPASMLYFERAHRTAPRDSAALGNLNLARRKIGLPEVGAVTSPRELILFGRDSLLPGEWMLTAAIAWFVMFAVIALRRRIGQNAARIGSAILLLVILIAVAAFAAQLSGPYHAMRGIVLGNGADLRSLPASSGRVEGRIPGGYEIRIIEQRSDYSLVRSGTREGWTENSNIESIW